MPRTAADQASRRSIAQEDGRTEHTVAARGRRYREVMGAEPADEALVRLPRPAAARAVVPDMVGYRTAPMPGVHRGLPSP